MNSDQTVERTDITSLSSSQAGGTSFIAANATSAIDLLGSLFRAVVMRSLSGWKWIQGKRVQQLASRRLRVAETLSLGDKRFVSIIQVDGAQFLIGGAAGSISLLAVLNKEERSTITSWHQAASSLEKMQ